MSTGYGCNFYCVLIFSPLEICIIYSIQISYCHYRWCQEWLNLITRCYKMEKIKGAPDHKIGEPNTEEYCYHFTSSGSAGVWLVDIGHPYGNPIISLIPWNRLIVNLFMLPVHAKLSTHSHIWSSQNRTTPYFMVSANHGSLPRYVLITFFIAERFQVTAIFRTNSSAQKKYRVYYPIWWRLGIAISSWNTSTL